MSMEFSVSTAHAGCHYEARSDILLPSVWSESVRLPPERSLRDESQTDLGVPVVSSLIESFPIVFSETSVATNAHSEKGKESRWQGSHN